MSRTAAKKHGYNLRRYELDRFGDSRSDDGKKWLFVYQCSPAPPPPGCSFMVVVDRKAGDTKIYPGE